MKKATLLILVLISNIIISQDEKNNTGQSNLTIFSSKSGTLIERQFIEVGEVNKTELQILKLTDMISGESISALRLKKKIKSTYSNDTKIATLDIDEIDALLKSFDIIKKSVLNTMPVNYTEITFTSREGFEAGCYYSSVKKEWQIYYKIEKRGSDSLVFINKDDLNRLIELLQSAKKML